MKLTQAQKNVLQWLSKSESTDGYVKSTLNVLFKLQLIEVTGKKKAKLTEEGERVLKTLKQLECKHKNCIVRRGMTGMLGTIICTDCGYEIAKTRRDFQRERD